MTIARIGDKIYDTAMIRCGCGESTIECEIDMERGARCCQCCDHVHSMHTLKLYGLLER